MKRTNIVLNEDLVAQGLQLTGLKTRRQLVDHALHEMVRHRRQKEILSLKGKIDWQGDLSTLRRKRVLS
jgi:Arc/MetJ family transcription regulator